MMIPSRRPNRRTHSSKFMNPPPAMNVSQRGEREKGRGRRGEERRRERGRAKWERRGGIVGVKEGRREMEEDSIPTRTTNCPDRT